MTVARRVVEAAAALQGYLRSAAAIKPDFEGAGAVTGALIASASYEPRQLEQGAVAYAALVALQEPNFVKSLSGLAETPAESAAFAERLARSPENVLDVPGAQQAAALASAALSNMGSALVDRGRAVKQAAYTLQQQPWSLRPVDEPATRLSRVKARAQSRATLTEAETQQLIADLLVHRSNQAAPPTAAPTPLIIRSLALAATAMLGRADEDHAEALETLLTDRSAGDCLKLAKLNLHQCLSVAGPQYEDVFCTGEHAMADTGQCIVKAAGGPSARGVAVPVALARTAVSVAIPVALGDQTPPDGGRAIVVEQGSANVKPAVATAGAPPEAADAVATGEDREADFSP